MGDKSVYIDTLMSKAGKIIMNADGRQLVNKPSHYMFTKPKRDTSGVAIEQESPIAAETANISLSDELKRNDEAAKKRGTFSSITPNFNVIIPREMRALD